LDPAEHRAWRGDVELALTGRELALLEYLLRCEGSVCSKTDIVDHVWDGSFDGDLNIVEVYIGHLRAKIDRPFERSSIQTVRGAGYRLVADDG
jgi:DNA-binding response OmpR family regulator